MNLFNTFNPKAKKGKQHLILATTADADKLTKEERAKYGVLGTEDKKNLKHKAGVPANAPVKAINAKQEAKAKEAVETAKKEVVETPTKK